MEDSVSVHLKGWEGKEGVPAVHNDELETVVFPRKMEHCLGVVCLTSDKEVATVSVESQVHTASRSLFSVTVEKIINAAI